MPLERILIVEDDAAIRELIAEILSAEGYLIDQAANGRDALLRMQCVRPDAILLDLMMPIMDGQTFAKTYGTLDHCSIIPIVVMSASPDLERSAEQLRPYGVLGQLPKPFDVDELLTMMQRLTTQSQLSPHRARLAVAEAHPEG
jgi:two-component system, chemotaxis family, chemotaxis protein CheY